MLIWLYTIYRLEFNKTDLDLSSIQISFMIKTMVLEILISNEIKLITNKNCILYPTKEVQDRNFLFTCYPLFLSDSNYDDGFRIHAFLWTGSNT